MKMNEKNPYVTAFNNELKRLLPSAGQSHSQNGGLLHEMIEAQQRLEQIIELLPDAMLVINLQGEVVFWNKAIEDMTGVPKSEMIGKGNYEYAIPFYGERRPILIDIALNEEREQELMDKYDFSGREEGTLSGEVYVPKTYGGKGAYLWGYASKLYDRKGNLYGAVQSIRDISDRKAAEEGCDWRRSGSARLVPVPHLVISTLKDGVF